MTEIEMHEVSEIESYLNGRFLISFTDSAVHRNMKCLVIQSVDTDTRMVKRAFYINEFGKIKIRWFNQDMKQRLDGITLTKENFQNIMVLISLMTIDEKLANLPYQEIDLMWFTYLRGQLKKYLGEHFDY